MRSVDERINSPDGAINAAAAKLNASLRVALPGIVQAFDPRTQTVTVQPAIRERVIRGNRQQDMDIPLLVDVPVVMPRGGGYSLVFAPQKGDECLIVFSDLCIDSWWQSGGVQNQAEVRRHDLSDAFAILGTWSQRRKPSIPSSGCRLQNDEGTAGVEIKGNTVNLFGNVRVNGATIQTGGGS